MSSILRILTRRECSKKPGHRPFLFPIRFPIRETRASTVFVIRVFEYMHVHVDLYRSTATTYRGWSTSRTQLTWVNQKKNHYRITTSPFLLSLIFYYPTRVHHLGSRCVILSFFPASRNANVDPSYSKSLNIDVLTPGPPIEFDQKVKLKTWTSVSRSYIWIVLIVSV